MVTDEGLVKVLDFGLAKLREETGEGSALTSILRDSPAPVTRVNPTLPHHLGRIVRRSLEKDPLRRYQDAADLGNELEDLKREVESGELAVGEADGTTTGVRTVVLEDPLLRQSWRGNLPFCWLADGRLVYARREAGPAGSDTSNVWTATVNQATGILSGSPRQITYLAGFNIRDLRATASGLRVSFLRERQQPDIYVAPLEQTPPRLGAPRRVTFDDRFDYSPTWTHDSKAVLFRSNRGGTLEVFRQALDERVADRVVAGAAPEPLTEGPDLSPASF